MSFDVYKLVYKFRGRIWGQGDQKWGFWVKNWEFPRGNNQEQGDLFWCNSLGRVGTRSSELHMNKHPSFGYSKHLGINPDRPN